MPSAMVMKIATMTMGSPTTKRYRSCTGYGARSSSGTGESTGHQSSTEAAMIIKCCTMWIGWLFIARL
jgi:hypothetical protein